MKKILVIILTAILSIVSAQGSAFANDSVLTPDEQWFLLDEMVEIPDVCIFGITVIELAAVDEEGFQRLSFDLFFQNMSLNAIDLSEFMELELMFQNRFIFDLVNPEDIVENVIRPLVRRTATLIFDLPNAALGGEHGELILSLSFDGSEFYKLDVLAALGLAFGEDDMDVPIVVLGRNMPLLTPGRWMNLGGFAVLLEAVHEFEAIPNLPDALEVDESERFLVASLSLRNLSSDELRIDDLVSAELIFRDRFVFEHIGVQAGRETLTPLEEITVFLTFIVPDIVLDSVDEELWMNFLMGDMELTVEVRDIIADGSYEDTPQTPEPTPADGRPIGDWGR